jgi:hypothetical protein
VTSPGGACRRRFTRLANDTKDYEDATALERAGGAILEVGAASWKRIAEAA